MAQQFSTGAVYCFIRTSGESPLFLGTCESMPKDTRSPEYEPLMNDISGSKIPLDFAWQGESAQISLILTYMNQATCDIIETAPGDAGGAGITDPGYWGFFDVGSLMGLEEEAVELWLAYGFGSALGNKTAYTAFGLRPGRHYPQTIWWAPQEDEIGSKPMKRHFMFYAWPKMDKEDKTFTLYDDDFTGIDATLID